MATQDVDRKMLGRLARRTILWSSLVSQHLYRILGLSIVLSQRINTYEIKHDHQNLDTSTTVVHHIIYLAREGLEVIETFILPYSESDGSSAELRVFAAKLRATFYHILCLYRNSPPIQICKPPPSRASTRSSATATAHNTRVLTPTPGNLQVKTPSPSPQATPPLKIPQITPPKQQGEEHNKENTILQRTPGSSSSSKSKRIHSGDNPPSSSPRTSLPLTGTPPRRRKTPFHREHIPSIVSDVSSISDPYTNAQRRSLLATTGTTDAPGFSKRPNSYLRETVPSMLSEASYITNPWTGIPPMTRNMLTPPPRPLPTLSPVPSPARFLLPSMNYVPSTLNFFSRAYLLARTHLPGSSPLRLSVAVEYATFVSQCLGDWGGANDIAKKAIEDSQKAGEECPPEDYDDAAPFVMSLMRLMGSSHKGASRSVSMSQREREDTAASMGMRLGMDERASM